MYVGVGAGMNMTRHVFEGQRTLQMLVLTWPSCLIQDAGSPHWETSWVKGFWEGVLTCLPSSCSGVMKLQICRLHTSSSGLCHRLSSREPSALAPEEGSSISVCVSFLDSKLQILYHTKVFCLDLFHCAPVAFSDHVSQALNC